MSPVGLAEHTTYLAGATQLLGATAAADSGKEMGMTGLPMKLYLWALTFEFL